MKKWQNDLHHGDVYEVIPLGNILKTHKVDLLTEYKPMGCDAIKA